ncbi:MAG: thiol:disulfide interchange protein DsbA/DsbL [Pseudomonadota bacterium]
MKTAVSALLVAASLFFMPFSYAASTATSTEAIKENQQYKVIQLKQAPLPSTQIEVIEFFSFGCPHCAHLEPTLQAWRKTLPANVSFRRVPVVFRPQWENLAKVYYTLDALKLSQLEPLVFKAIHESNEDLTSEEIFLKWAKKQKVDEKNARTMFESFTVNTRVSQAKTLAQYYQVEGVPLLIVANKYQTDVQMAGGPEKVPAVLNHLIRLAQNK